MSFTFMNPTSKCRNVFSIVFVFMNCLESNNISRRQRCSGMRAYFRNTGSKTTHHILAYHSKKVCFDDFVDRRSFKYAEIYTAVRELQSPRSASSTAAI